MDKSVNRKLLAKLALSVFALLHLTATGEVAAERSKAAPFNCHKDGWRDIDLGDTGREGGVSVGICFRTPTRSERNDIPDRYIRGAAVVPFFVRGRIQKEDGSFSCCEDYGPCDPSGPPYQQNKHSFCKEGTGTGPEVGPDRFIRKTKKEVVTKVKEGDCEITFDSNSPPEIDWEPSEPTNMTCETIDSSTDYVTEEYSPRDADGEGCTHPQQFVRYVTTMERLSCRGNAPVNPGDTYREVQTHFYPGQLYFAVNFKHKDVTLDLDGAPDAYYKGDSTHDKKKGVRYFWTMLHGKRVQKFFREYFRNHWPPGRCDPQLRSCGLASPCPGNDPDYCLSPTAVVYRQYSKEDQRKYLNASTIPFFVYPSSFANRSLRNGPYGIGDIPMVFTGERASAAIPADTNGGSFEKRLEWSEALFHRLGLKTTGDAQEYVDKASVVMFFNGSTILRRTQSGEVSSVVVHDTEQEVLANINSVERVYNSQLLGVPGMKAIAEQLHMTTGVN